MKKTPSIDGLDPDFLQECINELKEEEAVVIYGCKDEQKLIEYLENHDDFEIESWHITSDGGIMIIPFILPF